MSRDLQIGSHIYSQRYGRGEILAIDGYGEKERLTIRFETVGVKELLSSYALLEPFNNRLPAATDAPGPGPAPVRPSLAVEERSGEEPSGNEAPETIPAGRSEPVRPREGGGSVESVKEALREVLREELGAPEVRMLDRWKGGTMILKPGRPGQREKELPIDDLFRKIVMIRDRLRTLEQKVNGHAGLGDADKVELQQYVTRIYGSLTTFNLLFAEREDWFVGQKGGAGS